MNSQILILAVLCTIGIIFAQELNEEQLESLEMQNNEMILREPNSIVRPKRSLLLAGVLGAGAIGLGAGAAAGLGVGFGLGALKGYKYGRYSGGPSYAYGPYYPYPAYYNNYNYGRYY